MRRTVILIALLLVAGCGQAPAPSSPPATADVPTYRGDAGRSGVMPGPGPEARPTLAWRFQADAPIRSSPAVVGGVVFVASTDGRVHALHLATGEVRWRTEVGTELGAASPLVVDGLVVVGDKLGDVHALDATTGQGRWRSSADGPIAGAAAHAGGRVFVATETGVAVAFDAATGERQWQATLPGGVAHSVAATDDYLYGAIDEGRLVALRTSDGSIAWEASVAADGAGGTPTAAGGLTFAAAGLDSQDVTTRGIVALDAATGQERWRHASPSGEVMYAPAVADGRAIVVAEDGSVAALDEATGRQLWATTTGAPNDALPAIWRSTVYVATKGGTLQALETSTGTLLWEVDIQGVPYAPVVTGGFVLVGTNLGLLYAFGTATP